MNTLTELSHTKHKDLKILPQSAVNYAASLHMVHLRATEVPRSIGSLPVFFSYQANSRNRAISALTSFVPNQSLFIADNKWDAVYQPSSIRTYPLYLMRSESNKNSYSIGIVEESDAFSTTEGEPLFDHAGRPSLLLNDMQKLLESNIQEDMQSNQFVKKLDDLGLIKDIDLIIQMADQTAQTLTGLATINEDKLLTLTGSQLEELNKLGYLAPIHAMLLSIYQIHDLVRRNNEREGNDKISHVRIEVAKDRTPG